MILDHFFIPVHLYRCYKEKKENKVTYDIYYRGINLPSHNELFEKDIIFVYQKIIEFSQHERVYFMGGIGQAIVLEELLSDFNYRLIAIFDNKKNTFSTFPKVLIFFGWGEFEKWIVDKSRQDIFFVVSVGGISGEVRLQVHEQLKSNKLMPLTANYTTAFLSPSAKFEKGCQILAKAEVYSRTKLGISVIINTTACVDHECEIGKGVHIAPGAQLAVCVEVGDYSFVGIGASVLPKIIIGTITFIGAGSVVTKDLPDNIVAYGKTSKFVKNNILFQ